MSFSLLMTWLWANKESGVSRPSACSSDRSGVEFWSKPGRKEARLKSNTPQASGHVNPQYFDKQPQRKYLVHKHLIDFDRIDLNVTILYDQQQC